MLLLLHKGFRLDIYGSTLSVSYKTLERIGIISRFKCILAADDSRDSS